MAIIGKDIDKASQLLAGGDLVAIPTETVYGLAANALNEKAVLNIFRVKERPFFDPLIVHVHTLEQALNYAEINDERLMALAKKYWPGPLTLLLPKKDIVPDIVTSGLGRVGIRVPRHPLTQELLRKANLPLAAPSANPFGYISPTLAEHVQKQLGDKVSYILDGGNCSIGIESTIVGLEKNSVCVYRLGGLAVEAIEKIAGKTRLMLNSSSDPASPGQLSNHYAPNKNFFFGNQEELLSKFRGKKIHLIGFGNVDVSGENIQVLNLSEKGDMNEAAINLFRLLRQADESDADVIIASPVPPQGLGAAVNDRLSRAAIR